MNMQDEQNGASMGVERKERRRKGSSQLSNLANTGPPPPACKGGPGTVALVAILQKCGGDAIGLSTPRKESESVLNHL
jgi:hypothetical protein